MKADYQRQMDFYEPDNAHRVLIIGVGSIGSHIVFGLVRMGVKNIEVVDFDKVENHNLPNQFFSENGLPSEEGTLFKVHALKSSLELFMPDTMKNCNFITHACKVEDLFTNEYLAKNKFTAIFLAVDDMNVRKWVWNIIRRVYPNLTRLLIDPRVGGQYANIFSIRPRYDYSVYEESLWGNQDTVELPCTGRAVIDVTLCVSGECINRFRLFLRDKLQVLWTFHAYDIGSSVIMSHRELKHFEDSIVTTNETVLKVGSSAEGENTNG